MTAYATIAGTLKARSGLMLGPDKLYLLEVRLAPLLRREGLRGLDDLAARLRPGSRLEADMVDAMTTNESLFFRDGAPFEALRRILPALHATRPPGTPLRIWSAAAACGQEPYSIAMVCAGLAGAMPGRHVEILATDIAREPLRRASDGLYSQFEVERGLPAPVLARYFTKEGAQWRVIPILRDSVSFQRWNLLSDLRPLGMFDVIFCRNVLLYFDVGTKMDVLDAVASQMQPDGRLFLGGAETTSGTSDRFRAQPDGSFAIRQAD